MKMKISKLFRKKKLRASVAARRSLRASAETYDNMDEPNMKLSRALLIVLILHVVAVSGIVAFNAIKTRQDSFVKAGSAEAVRQNVRPGTSAPGRTGQGEENARASQRTSSTLENARPVTHSLPIEHAAKPADSGKIYVVLKGDNPVTIAKKLKVSYDNLIELNHISDPRKLQIGQKLLIPKAVKGKKTDE
jgi:LysM repeat protein